MSGRNIYSEIGEENDEVLEVTFAEALSSLDWKEENDQLLLKTDVRGGQEITGTATAIPRAPEETLMEKKMEQVGEWAALVTNGSKWQQTAAARQREAQKGLREQCRVTTDVRTQGCSSQAENK